MLYAAAAKIGGHDGLLPFGTAGMNYTTKTAYLPMRSLSAFLGSLIPALAYSTLSNLGVSTAASLLGACLVLFDNALVIQSRFINLDSILVFTTALAGWTWSKWNSVRYTPFTLKWWNSLRLLGFAVGILVSVKFTGLYSYICVLIASLVEVWELVTNPSIPLTTTLKHTRARIQYLVIMPVCMYLFFYYLHFNMLVNSSNLAKLMTPEFQAGLNGGEISDTYADVGYGSIVAIRHEGTAGGYIHSHPYFYPSGSLQQQMTIYPFRDENSYFQIKRTYIFNNQTPELRKEEAGFVGISSGDSIRLLHVQTRVNLHSHDMRMSWNEDKDFNEVTGYAQASTEIGDANDHWVIEVVDSATTKTRGLVKKDVKAIRTLFRLRHEITGCYLMSKNFKLPKWGFAQQEVSCSKKGRYDLTVWRVEYTTHEKCEFLADFS